MTQVEFSPDTPLNEEQKQLNREFIYDQKYKQKNPQTTPTLEGVKTQRLKKFAENNNISSEELFDQMKDFANISENNLSGGKFTSKDTLGLLKTDKDVEGRQARTRSLNEFASAAEEDLSEREDEDIYAHYMDQMKKAKLEEK